MGSSGRSTFGDYKPAETTKCDQSVTTTLEDVARSQYFSVNSSVPPKGTAVRLRKGQFNGRLVVEEVKSKLAIGNLPTKLNYLLLCQERDYAYEGEVIAAKGGRTPTLEVRLDPV